MLAGGVVPDRGQQRLRVIRRLLTVIGSLVVYWGQFGQTLHAFSVLGAHRLGLSVLRNDTKHIFVRQLALAELRKRTRGLRLHRCLALRGRLVVHLNGLLVDVEGSQFGGLRAGIGSL